MRRQESGLSPGCVCWGWDRSGAGLRCRALAVAGIGTAHATAACPEVFCMAVPTAPQAPIRLLAMGCRELARPALTIPFMQVTLG